MTAERKTSRLGKNIVEENYLNNWNNSEEGTVTISPPEASVVKIDQQQ